jgi:histidine ammonia-lyase
MAGEIVPLTHLAQTLLAEGRVLGPAGEGMPASAWFAQRGREPYEPRAKEGIALISGIAVAPAFAWHQLRALRATLQFATRVAAASIEAVGAPLESYEPEIARLRSDPGLAEIAASLRAALAGSQVRRAARQAAVSFRVVPQVHGALCEALDRLGEATLREMRTVGDNPAFVLGETADADRLLHGGNFHAAAHTAAIEGVSLAFAQVALLSERRLHRLLDARFSGLSPQLAARPGLDAGLIAMHKASLAFAAEIRSRAIPPSLQHADSSFGQEDAMTMALPALDRLDAFHCLARRLLACELYVAAVALDARGERAGSEVEQLKALVRSVIPPYQGDRSYGIELEALLQVLESVLMPAGLSVRPERI